MYNQPTRQLPNGKIVGTRYKSPIDCLWKTIMTEGPLALYKGNDDLKTFSQLVRINVVLQVRPRTSCELHLTRESPMLCVFAVIKHTRKDHHTYRKRYNHWTLQEAPSRDCCMSMLDRFVIIHI
jgi:hypothetical protein